MASNEANLEAKIEKKQVELERSEKRLQTLKKVKKQQQQKNSEHILGGSHNALVGYPPKLEKETGHFPIKKL